MVNGIATVIALLMAAAGRMHGIGGIPGGSILSKLIIATAFGLGSVILSGCPFAFLLGVFSAWGISLGHGNFYHMDGARDGMGGSTPESIEKWVRPLFVNFHSDIYKPAYSWACMGAKWLLVGLPLLWLAPVVVLFACAAYTVSFRFTSDSPLAEWLTTIFPGMLIFHLVAFWQYEAFFSRWATYLFQ